MRPSAIRVGLGCICEEHGKICRALGTEIGDVMESTQDAENTEENRSV